MCSGDEEFYLILKSLLFAKFNMLTVELPVSPKILTPSRDWFEGGIKLCWPFDSGLEEAHFAESLKDLGAIGIIESCCFGYFADTFSLEVCFTISLRLLATALSFSLSFIQ
jgi:hypothetical protein